MRLARPSGLAWGLRLASGVLLLALTDCGAAPPPPTVAQVKLVTTADVNPAQGGGGAPILVRVYQLASPAGFDKAEFFPLFNTDTAVLGEDLVKRDDYLMAPGTTKESTLTVPDRVTSLGIFAVYREFQTRSWHASVALPPHKTTPVNVSIGASGVVVAPAP